MSQHSVRRITIGIGLGILGILVLAAMVFFDGLGLFGQITFSLVLGGLFGGFTYTCLLLVGLIRHRSWTAVHRNAMEQAKEMFWRW